MTVGGQTRPAAGVAGGLSATGVVVITLFAAAFPLIVLPGTVADDTDVLPKVLLARAVVLVLAFLWVARALVIGRVSVRRTVLDLPVLAIVASAALSTVLSVNPVLSVYGSYTRYEGLLTILTYALMFWLTVQFIDRPQTARLLLRAMLGGAAVECVLACTQTLAASINNDLGVFGESATTYGGVARALGTMGNANNLAVWLAMLIPVGVHETLTVRAAWARVVAAAVTLTMLLTLILTFGRAAWLGAAVGVLVTVVMLLRRAPLRRPAIVAGGAVVITLLLVGGAGVAASRLGVPVLGPALNRLASIANPGAGSGGIRIGLYTNTVGMVAQRPLVGFGPDTFGLVFPSHAGADLLPGVVFDKAHSDMLQVAAAQGVLGVGAVLWMLVALLALLVRRRRRLGVIAVLGGVLAYETAIQLNFAWFPVTAPFWILLAAGTTLSESAHLVDRRLWLSVPGRALALAGCVVALAAAVLSFSVRPALANDHYAAALAHQDAGQRQAALREIAAARSDDPQQSQYAAYQGDLEAAVVGDRPGPGADLMGARRAYEAAIADGEIFASVPIRLTFVDIALGDQRGALAAAKDARALAPSGQAAKLVQELGG